MKIGDKIKHHRLELHLTQKELSEKLHVSRSTISNWEIGRNYPDIQMIVEISKKLNISIDELLKGDVMVVKKMADDTKTRKKQSVKIKILYSVILILVVLSSVLYLKFFSNKELEKPSQIESIISSKDNIIIHTKLPFFKSIGGYLISNDIDNDEVLNITISTFIDYRFEHLEEKTIPVPHNLIENKKIINIIDSDGNVIVSSQLKKNTSASK